jgi:hypothetical protein
MAVRSLLRQTSTTSYRYVDPHALFQCANDTGAVSDWSRDGSSTTAGAIPVPITNALLQHRRFRLPERGCPRAHTSCCQQCLDSNDRARLCSASGVCSFSEYIGTSGRRLTTMAATQATPSRISQHLATYIDLQMDQVGPLPQACKSQVWQLPLPPS